MKKPRSIGFALVLLITWATIGLLYFTPRIYAASSVSLGNADSYSVIAGTSITNSGSSSIIGDVGISPGTSPPNYSGFGTVTLSGTIHDADSEASSALTDTETAYGELAAQGCDHNFGAGTTDLAGKHLTPGVYCSGTFIVTGILSLDGPTTDVWIFKSSGNLTVSSAATVEFTQEASACNVWWYVPGNVNLESGSSFAGKIITNGNISMTSATLDGKAFTTAGNVTLDTATISGPSCAPALESSGEVLGESTCTADDVTAAPWIIEAKRVSPTSMSLHWGPYEGLDTFLIEYGPQKDNWLYNTKVTGFDTTINALPSGQPMWFRVAAMNECAVGGYSAPFAGGTSPGLPNTGIEPQKNTIPLPLILSLSLFISSIAFVFWQLKRLFSIKRYR
jgi:hypothetical protein